MLYIGSVSVIDRILGANGLFKYIGLFSCHGMIFVHIYCIFLLEVNMFRGAGGLISTFLMFWAAHGVYARAPFGVFLGIVVLTGMCLGLKPYHVHHMHDGALRGTRMLLSGPPSCVAHADVVAHIDGQFLYIINPDGKSAIFFVRHWPGLINMSGYAGESINGMIGPNGFSGLDVYQGCHYQINLYFLPKNT